jgi:hypothetical protein
MLPDDATGSPEGTSESQEPDRPATFLELIARARTVARRITARVRRVAGDTELDTPVLPPADAADVPTVRDPPTTTPPPAE